MSNATLPEALGRLNRYRHDRDAAEREFKDAGTKLTEARVALDIAEKAFDAAKDIFNAAVRDLHKPASSPSAQTLQWLAMLQTDSVLTPVDMEAAAAGIGWSIKPDALRQMVKRMVDTGIFDRLGRGEFRFKGEKALALGIQPVSVLERSSLESSQPPADHDLLSHPEHGGVVGDPVTNDVDDGGTPSKDGTGDEDEAWRDDDSPY